MVKMSRKVSLVSYVFCYIATVFFQVESEFEIHFDRRPFVSFDEKPAKISSKPTFFPLEKLHYSGKLR